MGGEHPIEEPYLLRRKRPETFIEWHARQPCHSIGPMTCGAAYSEYLERWRAASPDGAPAERGRPETFLEWHARLGPHAPGECVGAPVNCHGRCCASPEGAPVPGVAPARGRGLAQPPRLTQKQVDDAAIVLAPKDPLLPEQRLLWLEGFDAGAKWVIRESVRQFGAGGAPPSEPGTVAAAPPSSHLPCAACGESCQEFSVPNAAWNTLIRDDGREGWGEYLCLACFANIAAGKLRAARAALRGHVPVAQPDERLSPNEGDAGSSPAGHPSLAERLDACAGRGWPGMEWLRLLAEVRALEQEAQRVGPLLARAERMSEACALQQQRADVLEQERDRLRDRLAARVRDIPSPPNSVERWATENAARAVEGREPEPFVPVEGDERERHAAETAVLVEALRAAEWSGACDCVHESQHAHAHCPICDETIRHFAGCPIGRALSSLPAAAAELLERVKRYEAIAEASDRDIADVGLALGAVAGEPVKAAARRVATERDNAIASLREAGRAEMEAVATIARLTEERIRLTGERDALLDRDRLVRATLGAAPGETVQVAAERVTRDARALLSDARIMQGQRDKWTERCAVMESNIRAAHPWLETAVAEPEGRDAAAAPLLELARKLRGEDARGA